MAATAAAARNAILRHMRVKVHALGRPPPPCLNNLLLVLGRGFSSSSSDEVKGSFLDKSEVSDRVISVVKKFHKVDPSKAVTIRDRGIIRNEVVTVSITTRAQAGKPSGDSDWRCWEASVSKLLECMEPKSVGRMSG